MRRTNAPVRGPVRRVFCGEFFGKLRTGFVEFTPSLQGAQDDTVNVCPLSMPLLDSLLFPSLPMNRSRLLLTGFLCLVLLAACQKGRVRPQEIIIGNETVEVMMPTSKEITHPEHGKEEWFGVGAMTGAGEYKANGVSQAHVFADGTTIATVNLNIQPARTGTRFVAWLQKTGGTERVRLDILQNPLNDVRHVITAEVDKDLRAYTEVVVTLEQQSGYQDTDPVVSTGLLKEQKRP